MLIKKNYLPEIWRIEIKQVFIKSWAAKIEYKIFGIRIDLDEIEKRLEKRGFKVSCLIDDKYLKIAFKNRNNIKKDEKKIKKIIKNFSGIRENYIFFVKESKRMHSYHFKSFKLTK